MRELNFFCIIKIIVKIKSKIFDSKEGLSDLMRELLADIREGCKTIKQENLRKKRKRELIRLMVAHIFQQLARNKVKFLLR